ncbi:transcription factor bHLH117-like [Chenopodium quinoa]|uniref:transcription factor bHLH117-like n=1 Tax=Chenopodium quinoa TaxID=63459 RepID=UPI000B78F8F4|nr:transcription factor bHLH117-like [Chenopodium quinoa]
MEISEVSFLSLLMAPETSSNEDQFYDDSSPQNLSTFLPTPSMAPISDHDYHYCNNNNDNLLSPIPESYLLPPLLPPLMSPEFSSALPNLLSFENFPQLSPFSSYSPPQQPPQIQLPPPPPPPRQSQRDDYSLDSILENYFEISKQKRKSSSSAAAAATEKAAVVARRQRSNRRSKMSEKIYCLGKLLPGGHRHRKNTADMLEEAKKYVKFLQAQVNSLRTMPSESRFTELKLGFGDLRGIGELARLSRQQLLQVVVNSPAAQMVMADRGWCLATAEQVAMMKRIEARQKVIQQFMHNLPL